MITMIEDPNVELGEDVEFPCDLQIQVRKKLKIGDLTTLGPNTTLIGNRIEIGRECFGFGNLDVGGGGSLGHKSDLHIGDYCVFHNSHLNLAAPITIENFVGLSPNVDLVTHGYWQNPLLGYPREESPISIESGVIVGRGSLILPGVRIGENSVIGAMSLVSRDIPSNVIAVGNPCRVLRRISRPNPVQQIALAREIVGEYQARLKRFGVSIKCELEFPVIVLGDHKVDLLTGSYELRSENEKLGEDLRDFLRRWGIWTRGKRFRSMSDEEWEDLAHYQERIKT